jgi:hypothetical protein
MTQTVNILGLTHKVEIVPNLSANWDTLGDISYNEQLIRLDAGLSEERRDVVLLHEIVHGILNGLRYTAENADEKLVQGLAIGLYQALKNNNIFSQK